MPSKKDPFNSDHIDFLLTIADTGAIGKSGEKFNLSPSAATRLLDRYRYFFGDPLFVVSKGVLLPTSYFHNLRPKLEAFLELASTIRERDFDLKHCRRHFKFSCSPGFAPSMMAYVLPRILSEAPECTVEHVSIGESPISVLMSGDRESRRATTASTLRRPKNGTSLFIGQKGSSIGVQGQDHS